MSILKENDKPIHEQLEELIIERIRKGELKPNDRIESENSLARVYGISRSTVRSVYDRLVLKNILSRRAGKGTFVAIPEMDADVSLLVGFSKTMQKRGVHLTTKILSRQVAMGSREVLQKLGLSKKDKIIEIRRIRCLEEKPFVLHVAYLPLEGCQPVLKADLENIGLTSYIEDVLGLEIRKAKQTILANAAEKKVAESLRIDAGTPVLVVKGVSYQLNDIPIRYSISTYRSDIAQLQATSEKPIRNINA
jgi:DNA-binding GntR family transcriptional regulator